MLQRGKGRSELYMILIEGVLAVKYTFWQACCQSQEADVTVNDFSAFSDMRRGKNWAHKSNPINIYLKTDSTIFPRVQECLILDLHTELLSEGVENSCSSSLSNPCRGRWQVPIWQVARAVGSFVRLKVG